MNRLCKVFALAVSLALIVCGASCSGDDDDDDDNPATWTDGESGLVWQADSLPIMNWPDAMNYCEALEFGGASDWRLPTIGELRTLVRGCDATATGGACGVTDECLEQSCENDPCGGCENNGGPGPGGEYWPADLGGDTTLTWSSSTVADDEDNAWAILFYSADITEGFVKNTNELTVRCVR